MCILFIYGDNNPKPNGFKLILASNRDEYYNRPSAVASSWQQVKSPLYAFGGLDLEPGKEGGTWLGIGGYNKEVIKIGVLLNITGEQQKKNDVIGRGFVITDYITGNQSNIEYSKYLTENHMKYNSFNLVTAEIKQNNINIMNCSNAPVDSIIWNTNEAHSFGNSPPSVPFKKVQSGKQLFNNIIQEYQNKDELVDKCMQLLQNSTKFLPDNELLKRAPSNWGTNLSSIMVQISDANYGSRTRSVILIDSNNHMDFYEETMTTNNPNDQWLSTHLQHQF